MHFYFAYGSNMHPARMMYRCRDSLYLGAADLQGWQVVPRLYADLQRKQGAICQGALYLVSASDLASLDRYEGSPRIYKRKQVTVLYLGEYINAYTYIMTPETRRKRAGIPYPEHYRRICAEGARYTGIKNVFTL
jgi:gamma-glutamylcyclotransferase (GGCT)/AIG2-like uncharacterized protein YtfP